MLLVIANDTNDAIGAMEAIQASGNRRSLVLMQDEAHAVEWLRERATDPDPTLDGPPAYVVACHSPPAIDGVRLARLLRGDRVLSRIPLLVVADGESDLASRVPADVRWLTRPLDPAAVTHAIASMGLARPRELEN